MWGRTVGGSRTRSVTLSGSVLIALVLLSAGITTLPRKIDFGPFTALALLTGLALGLSVVVWGSRARLALSSARRLWPLLALLGWSIVSFAWYRVTPAGIQNVLVLAAFVSLTLASIVATRIDPNLMRWVNRMMFVAVPLAGTLFAIGLLVEGPDSDLILEPRPFSLFALVGLAWMLASWRSGSRVGGLFALGMLTLIFLSLSRMSLAVGLLVLLPLSFIGSAKPGTWLRNVSIAVVLSVLVFGSAILFFQPLRERFVEGDREKIAGVTLNVTGRLNVWRLTWESYVRSPWVGHGAGSADNFVASSPDTVLRHPHNEYLRILHDYGIIGLGLWLLGYALLLSRVWEGVRRGAERPDERTHLAALLTLAAIGTAVTSNQLIYLFVMGPTALVVGTSLGRLDGPVRPTAAEQGQRLEQDQRLEQGQRLKQGQRLEQGRD
jgi:O-antigen ligase